MNDPSSNLMTAAEVAKILNCSPSWVYKAADRGEIPAVRLGAMLRFNPEALRAYLAAKSSPRSK